MEIRIDNRPFISAIQAASELQKSACTVFREAKRGAFRAVNINGQFIDKQQFQAWKEKQEATKKQNAS